MSCVIPHEDIPSKNLKIVLIGNEELAFDRTTVPSPPGIHFSDDISGLSSVGRYFIKNARGILMIGEPGIFDRFSSSLMRRTPLVGRKTSGENSAMQTEGTGSTSESICTSWVSGRAETRGMPTMREGSLVGIWLGRIPIASSGTREVGSGGCAIWTRRWRKNGGSCWRKTLRSRVDGSSSTKSNECWTLNARACFVPIFEAVHLIAGSYLP